MTDEEIRTVRDACDLAELVGEDVALHAKGSRRWACCPFHDERTPSFMVDERTQRYRCFGCGAHGDVIDYVMRRNDVPFVEAITLLAERAGIELSQERAGKGKPSKGRIQLAVAHALRHASSILADDGREDARRARKWLAEHGIGGSAIRRWGIGYTPSSAVLCQALRDAGFTDREIRSSGMCHGDEIRHIVCTPVRDAAGKAVGLAGQIPDGQGRVFVGGIPSPPKMTYVGACEPAQPEATCYRTLFGLGEAREAIRVSGEAVVTLTPLGAIALHERGVRNSVSCMGGGLGTGAARALAAAGANDVALLFPTNRHAALAARASLKAAILVPIRLSLARVDGKDALTVLRNLDAGDIKALCDDAPEIILSTLDDVIARFDLDDPQELMEAASEACEAFAAAVCGDQARAGIVERQVADRLGVCDPTTLTHALLADGPVGRPEVASGIDPSRVENPRRALPMSHVAIDFPTPTRPATASPSEPSHGMTGSRHAPTHHHDLDESKSGRGTGASSPAAKDTTKGTYMANSLTNVTIHGRNVLDILATPAEISRMSDAAAVSRIDLLRETAHEASSIGEDQAARAMLNNAVRIAESNYVCTDVITEYADFLEGQGFPEYATEYRNLHQELTGMLAQHGLPNSEYECRLHIEAKDQRGRPLSPGVDPRPERLGDLAAQSVTAAGQLREGRALCPDAIRNRE